VTRDVRDVGPLEEPLDLLGRFDGADLAIVIDAVRSGAPIGTVRVLDLDVAYSDGDSLGEPAVTSTHGIGLVGCFAWRERWAGLHDVWWSWPSRAKPSSWAPP